jgi:hypothetical protein
MAYSPQQHRCDHGHNHANLEIAIAFADKRRAMAKPLLPLKCRDGIRKSIATETTRLRVPNVRGGAGTPRPAPPSRGHDRARPPRHCVAKKKLKIDCLKSRGRQNLNRRSSLRRIVRPPGRPQSLNRLLAHSGQPSLEEERCSTRTQSRRLTEDQNAHYTGPIRRPEAALLSALASRSTARESRLPCGGRPHRPILENHVHACQIVRPSA